MIKKYDKSSWERKQWESYTKEGNNDKKKQKQRG